MGMKIWIYSRVVILRFLKLWTGSVFTILIRVMLAQHFHSQEPIASFQFLKFIFHCQDICLGILVLIYLISLADLLQGQLLFGVLQLSFFPIQGLFLALRHLISQDAIRLINSLSRLRTALRFIIYPEK